jgi:hypothetical protein
MNGGGVLMPNWTAECSTPSARLLHPRVVFVFLALLSLGVAWILKYGTAPDGSPGAGGANPVRTDGGRDVPGNTPPTPRPERPASTRFASYGPSTSLRAILSIVEGWWASRTTERPTWRRRRAPAPPLSTS